MKVESLFVDIREKTSERRHQREEKVEKSEDTEVLFIGYEQNLPLPRVTSEDIFYKRQCWVYNFVVPPFLMVVSCFFTRRHNKIIHPALTFIKYVPIKLPFLMLV